MSGLKISSDWFDVLKSDGLLREALAAGNVGIWSWDLKADVFLADAVTRRLWWLPEGDELPAEQILGAVHPADVAAVRTAALSAQAMGECHAVFRLLGPCGAIRWLRIRGRVDKSATKDRILGVTIDITKHKRLEADLAATEGRLQRALELGGAVPFEWDAVADHVIAPPTLRALYGFGPDDPFDLPALLDRIHPDDRLRVEDDHRRLMSEPGLYESEFRVILPDGGIRWILSRGEGIRDEAGRPVGIAGINIDITARKRLERVLRRNRRERRGRFRELQALYQNAPVGLALLDRDLKFVRINEAFARMSGRPADDHIGRYAFDMVPKVRAAAEPRVRQVLDTGQPIPNVAFETPHQSDITRHWRIQLYPIKGEAGRVSGVGIVCEEVTEQRRAEQARDLLSRELSHRIKNMFAVMSSMVRLSARGNEAVQPFAQTIRGRIEALGRAHDYVRPLGNSGDDASHPERSLHALMQAILEPYLEDDAGERVHIVGADAAIDSAAATAFALAIHEFATNAVKYGALSTPGGTVEIACRAEAGLFKVTWSERGGPPIDQPPKREGFGTTVVQRSFSGELGGTIRTEWGKEGLTIRLSAPLDRLGTRT